MPLVLADRVLETTTTTGSGTITLAGAKSGYQSFSVIGNTNTTYYTIAGVTEWEVGIGTYTASGTTLSRDTVLASSAGGAKVTFSAGSKDVFVTYPAGRSVESTSATITTLSGTTLAYTSANITTITGTTAGFTSGNITTLTSSSGTIANLLATSATISGVLLVRTTTNTNSSAIAASGTISEGVSGVQYLVASQFDIGTAPNQIPLNQYLGGMAYQDPDAVTIGDLTATSLTLTNPLGRAQGGTGVSTAPTNGQLLIGNGTGYALSTLTAGTGITVTNNAGSITIAASSTGGAQDYIVQSYGIV